MDKSHTLAWQVLPKANFQNHSWQMIPESQTIFSLIRRLLAKQAMTGSRFSSIKALLHVGSEGVSFMELGVALSALECGGLTSCFFIVRATAGGNIFKQTAATAAARREIP